MCAHSHRTLARVQQIGNLAILQSVDSMQNQNLALVGFQLLECAAHAAQPFIADGRRAYGEIRLHGVQRSPPPVILVHVVQANATRHGVQPASERRVATKRVAVTDEAQKHLVGQVGGIGGIPDHAVAERDHLRLPPPIQRREMSNLARRETVHVLVVGELVQVRAHLG